MLKKFFLVFLTTLYLFTLSLSSWVPKVSAAEPGTWYNQSFQEWFLKVYDNKNPQEIFGERYTAAQVEWVLYSILAVPFKFFSYDAVACFFSGDLVHCLPTLFASSNIQTNPLAKAPDKNLVQLLIEDRPLSGITYVKTIARKFKLIPEAQAQTGFGFSSIDTVLGLWKGSRNIAYLLLVLVTLTFAFMIMFRVKISPQVVITVQSALPKIVLTIILVTFSYAIAGFLVDLMYVVIAILSFVFSSPLGMSSTSIFNILTKGQPLNVDFGIGFLGLFVIYLIRFLVASIIVFFTALGIINTGIVAGLGAIAFFVATASGIGITLIVIMLLLLLLGVFLALVWHFFRILFSLFKAFANILLLTIFAPFQLILGALISSMGFGSWVKNFVSNLAVFVVTGVLFLLSIVFLEISVALALRNFLAADIVQLIGNVLIGTVSTNVALGTSASWPPLLSIGGDVGTAMAFLGASFVVVAIIPKTADLIQSFISGKPFAYGTAIGEALGPVKAGGLWAAGEGFNKAEEIAKAVGKPTPGWAQAGRKLSGLRS